MQVSINHPKSWIVGVPQKDPARTISFSSGRDAFIRQPVPHFASGQHRWLPMLLLLGLFSPFNKNIQAQGGVQQSDPAVETANTVKIPLAELTEKDKAAIEQMWNLMGVDATYRQKAEAIPDLRYKVQVRDWLSSGERELRTILKQAQLRVSPYEDPAKLEDYKLGSEHVLFLDTLDPAAIQKAQDPTDPQGPPGRKVAIWVIKIVSPTEVRIWKEAVVNTHGLLPRLGAAIIKRRNYTRQLQRLSEMAKSQGTPEYNPLLEGGVIKSTDGKIDASIFAEARNLMIRLGVTQEVTEQYKKLENGTYKQDLEFQFTVLRGMLSILIRHTNQKRFSEGTKLQVPFPIIEPEKAKQDFASICYYPIELTRGPEGWNVTSEHTETILNKEEAYKLYDKIIAPAK